MGIGFAPDVTVLLQIPQPARNGGHGLLQILGKLGNIDGAIMTVLLDHRVQMLQHTQTAFWLTGQSRAHTALAQPIDMGEKLHKPLQLRIAVGCHNIPHNQIVIKC